MRVSTRTQYGLRLLLDLALHYGKGFCLLKAIARRQELSEKYLSLIIIPLRAAGLVISARGARGGYVLARPPAEITVLEIVEAIEGRISVISRRKDRAAYSRAPDFAARTVWNLLSQKIAETLRGISLADLVETHNKNISTAVNFEI